MSRRPKWAWYVALFFACIPMFAQQTAEIPPTHGTTLAGTEVRLPDAFKTKITILVVGFSHASQEQIANWGRLISADYGKSQEVDYFELAMLAKAPKLLRGMILKRLQSTVRFDERPHFIPVLEDESGWRTAAHYDKPDDAYILLVDRKGTVLWQTDGEPTNAAYARFKAELTQVLEAQSDRSPGAPSSAPPH